MEEAPADRSIGNIRKGFGGLLANGRVCFGGRVWGDILEGNSNLFAKSGGELEDKRGGRGITSFTHISASA